RRQLGVRNVTAASTIRTRTHPSPSPPEGTITMSSTSTIPTSRSTLPAPTGTHPIGRISTECEDRDRVDPYAPDPSTPRHLVLWIWYPTDPASSGAPADFLPRP